MRSTKATGGKTIVEKILAKVAYVQKKRKPIEDDWAENARFVNGDFSSEGPMVDCDRVDVNLLWSLVRSIVPGIYFRDPSITVEPENPQGIDRAKLLQAILQYRFRKMKVKKVIQKMIVDALIHHAGYCKVGYVVEDFQAEAAVDPITGEVTQVTDESTYRDLAEHQIEMRDRCVGSHSTIHRVSPRNLYKDSKATGIDDAQWMAEEIVVYLDDLLEDPNYENTQGLKSNYNARTSAGAESGGVYEVDVDDHGSSSGLGPFGDDDDESNPEDDELVRIIEFWDRRTRRVYTVAPGHPKVLRDVPWPYPRFPYFELMLTLPVSDEPYPMPIVSAVKPQQLELTDIRSYQLDFIKRSVTKYAVDVSMVDQGSYDQLRRGDGVPVVKVTGDPRVAIQALQGAPMNPEVHVAEQAVKGDMQQVSGVAEFRQGAASPKGTTATEQRLMAASQSLTVEMMIDVTQDLVVEIANFVADLEMTYTDKTQIVRITGDAGVEWRQWTNADIEGDYEVSIHAGTQLHIDQAIRAKQALDRFNLAAPIALQGGPMKFYPIARDMLEATGAKNIKEYIDEQKIDEPPHDPWMEEELFKMGGAAEVSINDEDDQHLPIHLMGEQAEQDPIAKYKRQMHIREHEMSKQRKQQMMLASLMQIGGPMGAAAGAGPGPGQSPMGRVNSGGMGRQQPAPGNPANPRQFSQKNPNVDGVMRAASISQGVP